jgi:squalene-hopene/tetraprenyl-beta-curcumene cyclase
MLAVGDGIAGESDPRTRGEFDRVWTMQRPDGSFYWPTGGGMLPFLERDADYIAALVALGAGYLPASYLATPAASAGLERTVSFLKSQPASDLHAEMILLWASVRTPGLMDSSQRDRTIARVRALQRPDGGWSLPSFGNWRRHDGPPNDPIDGPSDGYATGLAALVLCETGAGGADSSVQRGLAWLRGNQRASGRWFTRSLYSDQFQHYLSNMATTYAVIALQTCDPREPR